MFEKAIGVIHVSSYDHFEWNVVGAVHHSSNKKLN